MGLPTDREPTVKDIAYYLFGNPVDPRDTGLIGRMQASIDRLSNIGTALLLTFIAAILAFAAEIVVQLVTKH